MTTCTFSIAELALGRKDIQHFKYHGYPPDRVLGGDAFPSFAAGLAELGTFGSWAADNGLKEESPDHVTYVVACKRRHLLDFWERCYGGKSGVMFSKERADQLREQLEELDPRKLYVLIAYEY